MALFICIFHKILYKTDPFPLDGIRKMTYRFVFGWFSLIWDGRQQKENYALFDDFSSKKSKPYGPDISTVNHAYFWSRRFRSGNFAVKIASLWGKLFVENADKNGNR